MNSTAELAGVRLGDGFPVRIMGVINVSPESFYKASVQNRKGIQKAARKIEEEGADIIDIGAMSTAPYLETQISEEEEAERLTWAVRAVRAVSKLPISVDTSRPLPAISGLKAGGDILNDVTALAAGEEMWPAVRLARGVVVMANPMNLKISAPWDPVATVKKLLGSAIKTARAAGAPANRIVIDPGIGFFRRAKIEWWKWDLAILRDLAKIAALPAPVLVGVSRKSFISQVLDSRIPEERLSGSLAATVVSVLNGASLIRTHDVGATKDAVRVAQAIQLERISFRKV